MNFEPVIHKCKHLGVVISTHLHISADGLISANLDSSLERKS